MRKLLEKYKYLECEYCCLRWRYHTVRTQDFMYALLGGSVMSFRVGKVIVCTAVYDNINNK